jgi:hypothetical protein
MALTGSVYPAHPLISKKTVTIDTIHQWRPLFDSSFQKGLFRTSMDIRKNHLTGYLFIKKVTDTSYRVLFSNEIGMTFFDIEFLPRQFIVHSCFPSLNRKSLLNLLENDFRILFFMNDGIKKITPVKSKEENRKIYKITKESGKWRYKVSDPSGSVLFIGSVKKLISKTRIETDPSETTVNSLSISNPVIKLNITMKLISR